MAGSEAQRPQATSAIEVKTRPSVLLWGNNGPHKILAEQQGACYLNAYQVSNEATRTVPFNKAHRHHYIMNGQRKYYSTDRQYFGRKKYTNNGSPKAVFLNWLGKYSGSVEIKSKKEFAALPASTFLTK